MGVERGERNIPTCVVKGGELGGCLEWWRGGGLLHVFPCGEKRRERRKSSFTEIGGRRWAQLALTGRVVARHGDTMSLHALVGDGKCFAERAAQPLAATKVSARVVGVQKLDAMGRTLRIHLHISHHRAQGTLDTDGTHIDRLISATSVWEVSTGQSVDAGFV